MDTKYKLALQLIEHFEGFSSTAYFDELAHGRPLTIGFGRTYGVSLNDFTTRAYERQWVLQHLYKINEIINETVWPYLDPWQMAALLDFVYNLGHNAFRRSTLVKRLNRRDPEAAEEILRWNKAGGVVLPGLVRRRKAEYNLFINKELKFYEH